MSDVIDISRDRDTGEITQFTVFENGQPELKNASAENLLLYDPEEVLPFDNGMAGFIQGSDALILSESDPEIMVAPTSDEYCYILRVDGNTIETTADYAETILVGIKEAALNQNYSPLQQAYDNIIAEQVRRDLINVLHKTFDDQDRIDITSSGWLIDDFYLVDWNASMYAKTDNPDEVDVIRRGSGVVEADRSYEFVELRMNRDIEPVKVSINGNIYRLSEREMLFLSKVNWLLDRRHYHPDQPFWKFADKRASVDWKTGEPLEEDDDTDQPDMDSFSL